MQDQTPMLNRQPQDTMNLIARDPVLMANVRVIINVLVKEVIQMMIGIKVGVFQSAAGAVRTGYAPCRTTVFAIMGIPKIEVSKAPKDVYRLSKIFIF